MLISIVIPVYNVSFELLKRCLDSIYFNKDESIEVLIIDDGSDKANSTQYMKLCQEFNNANYFYKENTGPSDTRNYGVEKSKGEYIVFLDADDYITDFCLEQAITCINKYHPDILFGYVYKDLNDNGKMRNFEKKANPDCLLLNKEDIVELTNHILGYCYDDYKSNDGYLSDGPWCRFFRKVLFDNTKFDTIPRWNEDTLWNIQLLHNCKDAVILKSVWYVYAIRDGSAMQTFRQNCFEEFMYITQKVSDAGDLVWNGEINKGIASRVWHDLFILSRSLIFNSKNNNSLKQKYNMFIKAITSNAYQKAVKTIDFKSEKVNSKRIVKELLNLTMKARLYTITYLLIKIYICR